VRVISLDPNNRQVIVEHVREADREWQQRHQRVTCAVDRRQPVRARITRLVRNRQGTPVGLLAQNEGQPIFIHANQSLQLVTFPEAALQGLPILVMLTDWDPSRNTFVGSLQAAYEWNFRGLPAPAVGDVCVGLGLVVEGETIVVLLPGRTLGRLDARGLAGLPRESWTEACGTPLDCRVAGELPGSNPRTVQLALAA